MVVLARNALIRCVLPSLLVLFSLLPARAFPQAFPFYDQSTTQDEKEEKWILYPFYSEERTSNSLTIALHPVFSWYKETDTEKKDFDVLWPIFSYRYRPETQASTNYRSGYLFPLYYERSERRFGRDNFDRIILPIWFEGTQGDRGRYQILVPFYWYSRNARLTTPMFPPREQTFAALFPIAGDFRGYWNRDRIRFLLWPLFVHSSEGTGSDYNQIHSILWPFFGVYSGPKVSGFRIWPLFAYVEKEGESKRAYWLWPLGHYRKGRIGKTNDGQQDVVLFIPFYARFRQPNVKLDMVFPFYGKLEVGDRVSRGYVLALYNTDLNYRKGTREQRFLLFLFRRKTPLPGYDPASIDPDVTLGGGVFPIYMRTHNANRIIKSILWPLHQYRYNRYNEFTYTRSYILPVYSRRTREFNNGDTVESRFVFPFFRYRKSTRDNVESNALHLFYYSDVENIDRLYAPLWSWWEKRENLRSGEKTLRWFRNAWIYERTATGEERKRANLLLYNFKSETAADGTKTRQIKLFFGLIRHSWQEHRAPDAPHSN